jgi:hypothetical protein
MNRPMTLYCILKRLILGSSAFPSAKIKIGRNLFALNWVTIYAHWIETEVVRDSFEFNSVDKGIT